MSTPSLGRASPRGNGDAGASLPAKGDQIVKIGGKSPLRRRLTLAAARVTTGAGTLGAQMYPVIRLIGETLKFRGQSLGLLETHVSHHLCLPWDLDPWMELNNGRTLTLYDLGRIPFTLRIGMTQALRAQGWGMTVAGASVRYRRRVRMFQRVQMRSRLLGWDQRFFYVEQSLWRQGEALNHILLRIAATQQPGILPPVRLIEAMGHAGQDSPALPDWVQGWIAADSQRPWPPQQG